MKNPRYPQILKSIQSTVGERTIQSKHGFVTTVQRSRIMKSIGSKATTPEILLRKALRKSGLRFQSNVKNILGNPDIVLQSTRLVIFVDGDFWHGFKWKDRKSRLIRNRDYWIAKIEGNIARDKRIRRRLRKQGWRVVRLWEHQVRKDPQKCMSKIIKVISQ